MQFALALHIGDGFVGSWRFSVLRFILLAKIWTNGHVCSVGGFHKSWHCGVGDDGNIAFNLEHALYLDSLVVKYEKEYIVLIELVSI